MSLRTSLLTFLTRHDLKGRDWLIGLLTRQHARGLIRTKVKYGISLYLNPLEYIDKIIIREGFYESEITEEIFKYVQNGGVLWDIGANIGIHSIAVNTKFPATKVYCFEPGPKTLSALYDNVALNGLDINICGFALYESAGSMSLFLTKGNSGMSTLTPWDKSRFNSSIQCLTTTGDTLLAEGYEVPTVIKLDTEGSELNILKGCPAILASTQLKVILLEAHNDLLDNIAADETMQYLKQFGFTEVKLLERNENTHHGLSNFAVMRE